MIRRRAVVLGAAAALLGLANRAASQRGGTLPRVGFLTPGHNQRDAAFWQGMRDLGYVEGRDITVERRSSDGDFTKLPALAVELVRARPNVLVGITSSAAIALQQATPTIPIVMVGISDPIAAGLVGNLARPGGNVTGTSSQSNAAVGKLFEVMRQILPGVHRVAALWNPTNAISQQIRLSEILAAGAKLQILVRVIEVSALPDLDRAFAALDTQRPDAVLVPGDAFFMTHGAHAAELSIRHRLPTFSTSRLLTEVGMFASYGADLAVIARRSAAYVQKILKGAKPGELPVELPTRFELVINERTAKPLGVVVPPAVLTRADEVIR